LLPCSGTIKAGGFELGRHTAINTAMR